MLLVRLLANHGDGHDSKTILSDGWSLETHNSIVKSSGTSGRAVASSVVLYSP